MDASTFEQTYKQICQKHNPKLSELQPFFNTIENHWNEDEIQHDMTNALNELLKNKGASDLRTECSTCGCNGDKSDVIFTNCESIKRIMVILTGYKQIKEAKLLTTISLTKTLTVNHIYTASEINDDFLHIMKDHIHYDKENEIELTRKFRLQFKCTEKHQFRRWKVKENYPKSMTDDDIILKQICQKIYENLTYFEYNDKKSKPYITHAHDTKWFQYKNEESNQNVYSQLLQNMGTFRRQSCHGFSSRQHQALMHLKPKYENIKQEIFENPFYNLSKDNWNQTLRKATVFKNSFARHRIKTTYEGQYNDKISGRSVEWKIGETINLMEIVVFKLYTDFDKLQFELKKCFRFETINDIFCVNNVYNQKERFVLEERLKIFYKWRVELLTVLNKYAQPIDMNVTLYHGVNSKMIINNATTQPFYGPLSTSLSYHVAQTFATSKGMVMEVTSQFPGLGYCKAFDASLISDYPEEREQIISFAYLKIKTIFTKPLNKNWKTFSDIDEGDHSDISLASKMRSIFFAVHLFWKQIFSMSFHCEYWVTAFLYLQCYNRKYYKLIKKNRFVDLLKSMINGIDQREDKQQRIMKILYNKFNDFRKCPNRQQTIKICEISENLKPYFLDYIRLDIHNNPKYIISFEKIANIFENCQEIQLINLYTFDNNMLSHLDQYLFKYPMRKLKKIKFIYYNGQEPEIKSLDKILLNRLKDMGFEMKYKRIKNTSFEITISAITQIKKQRIYKQKIKGKCEKIMYNKQYTSLHISRKLTNILSTGIKQRIKHLYRYMIKATAFHKDNCYHNDSIKIFNYKLYDKNTNELLYFVAEKNENRNYKWKLMDRIFTAKDIENIFGISSHQLPVFPKLFSNFMKHTYKKNIKQFIKNKQIIQMLETEEWKNIRDKIRIHNRPQYTRRITLSLEKKEFINELIQFRVNNNCNSNLIEIVMKNIENNEHHIEFVEFMRIKVTLEEEEMEEYKHIDTDIGLSYKYNEIKNKVELVGIHIDKHFIQNQHQLICEHEECKCLKNIRSNIHFFTIGNPDYYKNNMNRYKKQLEQQKQNQNINCNKNVKNNINGRKKHKKKNKGKKILIKHGNNEMNDKLIALNLNVNSVISNVSSETNVVAVTESKLNKDAVEFKPRVSLESIPENNKL